MNTEHTFKTSPRGFRKKDVIKYIDGINKDFFTYRKENEAEIYRLRLRISELEEQLERSREETEILRMKHEREQSENEIQGEKFARKLGGLLNTLLRTEDGDADKGRDREVLSDMPVQETKDAGSAAIDERVMKQLKTLLYEE